MLEILQIPIKECKILRSKPNEGLPNEEDSRLRVI